MSHRHRHCTPIPLCYRIDSINLTVDEFAKIDLSQCLCATSQTNETVTVPLGSKAPILIDDDDEDDSQGASASASTSASPSPTESSSTPSPSTSNTQRRVKKSVKVNYYYWRMYNASGEPIQDSMCKYFSEQNCKDELAMIKQSLMSQGDNGQVSGEIKSVLGDLPSQKTLCEKVYRFLLEGELQDRVRMNCQGCVVKSSSQKDHKDGCLMDRSAVVQIYAKAAHNRISAKRLVEGCSVISTYFSKPGYVDLTVTRRAVDNAKPEEVLLSDPYMYESEFALLKKA